jgi:Ca2+-binding RTX toxin-like protein
MGRRAILLLTSLAVMVGVSAGLALGATIVGTNAANILQGTANPDKIAGAGGNDTISGLAGNDLLFGDSGSNTVNGGGGRDIVFGDAGGASTANGKDGDRDWVSVADRDTRDLAVGGAGDEDTCVIDKIRDQVGDVSEDEASTSCEVVREVTTDLLEVTQP